MSVTGIEYAGRTDVGRSRKRNEDSYYAGGLPGTADWTLLAVADGLGGHVKGDWASSRTLELLSAGLGALVEEFGPAVALREACHRVNWDVYSEARAGGAVGAATTLVAALVRGADAWWLNVGDSRLYVRNGGDLRQVSSDHSWVGEQVALGLLDREGARRHPNRNVVTRTIGFEAGVKPDIGGPITLTADDTLVLCSDGLFGPVDDSAISAGVAGRILEDSCRALVHAANEAGGPDNITVVLGRLRAWID